MHLFMENNISMTNLILWVGGQKKDFFLDMNLKILQLVTQIKDIQIYQFIKEDNYDKFSQESINIKEYYRKCFKKQADKIDQIIYDVEKALDQIQDQLNKIASNKLTAECKNTVVVPRYFENIRLYIEKLNFTANIYLKSSIILMIQNSFNDIQNYFRSFYSIIPFADPSEQFIAKIPAKISEIRAQAIQRLNLGYQLTPGTKLD